MVAKNSIPNLNYQKLMYFSKVLDYMALTPFIRPCVFVSQKFLALSGVLRTGLPPPYTPNPGSGPACGYNYGCP